MKTILEFLELTKGTSYLIAIAFLCGFIAFWLLLYGKGKRLTLRIIPLVILAAGFSGLASTCIIQKPVETVAQAEEEMAFLSPTILVELYGPALFDHESHQDIEDCATCHHYSEDRTPHCNECHAEPFDPKNLNKPGIAHVFHLRCISCHKEEQVGPTDCTGCHHKADIPPLSIAHPLTGVENCLRCHMGQISGVPKVPPDHASATNGLCQVCHKQALSEEDLASRPLPHEVEEYEDCLMCHGEGIVGAPTLLEDHTGRTNETCLLCHKTEEQELERPKD